MFRHREWQRFGAKYLSRDRHLLLIVSLVDFSSFYFLNLL